MSPDVKQGKLSYSDSSCDKNNKGWLDCIETGMNACSLESLNCLGKRGDFESLVMIGCYQLDELTGKRNGQLRLYRVNSEEENLGGAPVHVTSTDGVLDGKWISFQEEKEDAERYIFASATATGLIQLHELHAKESSSTTDLKALSIDSQGELISNNNSICLALDYTIPSFLSTQILSSYSNGEVAVHEVQLDGEWREHALIQEITRFKAHSLFGCPSEVWSCSWIEKHTSPNCFLTGGDDCKLKGWDMRMNNSSPMFIVGDEVHSAGVTCISYHPRREFIFASGSYDETIRIWDIRKLGGKKGGHLSNPLSSIENCGGTWRLKWHPTDDNQLLVAGMHKGCKVLRIDAVTSIEHENNSNSIEILESFEAHESMAYGADWIYIRNKEMFGSSSCSFYDQKAFMWQVKDA